MSFILGVIAGLVVGTVFGILFGRKNKKGVEKALADAKVELEKLKSKVS